MTSHTSNLSDEIRAMPHRLRDFALVLLWTVQIAACHPGGGGAATPAEPGGRGAEAPAGESAAAQPVSPHNAVGTRNAYFGDLHVHTGFSMDAFVINVRTNPDDAYRYARGEPLMHPGGYPIRLRGAPLDFMAVTEHAFYMGVLNAASNPNHELSKSSWAAEINWDSDNITVELNNVLNRHQRGERDASESGTYPVRRELLNHPNVMRDAWQQVIAAAERHYRPGQFTTFIGYEYTSHPGYNMHRNVIFRGTNVPDLPFGALESRNPEDLWRWLDKQRSLGNEALAIPHNSNWSAGHMFARQQESGDAFDAEYAGLRMRNEPIVEMTQTKGTSETHPLLSPNDEWANFEIWNVSPQIESTDQVRGGYVRDAYLAGLAFEETAGFNPYRFGMIGSSDGHNGGTSYEESSYFGASPLDGTPELRGSVPLDGANTWPKDAGQRRPNASWGASGLAGVWADENTREAIYDALRRKETFATSGPRIRVRLFGGFDYPDDLPGDRDALAQAYAGGVPMGGDLVATDGKAPRFFAWAARDPGSTWLERLQIVKGWIQDGEALEQVFDVACSGNGEPDPDTHRCPDSGASVNLSDCSTSAYKGAAELSTLWSDPSFDPGQRAFYYVRVLENPTCRWSTWEAIRAEVPPNPEIKATTIQERAWSSPIWYVPH